MIKLPATNGPIQEIRRGALKQNATGIGDDKIRVNSSSLDHPLVILPDQGLEIVAIEKKVMVGRAMRSAYWLNHDPSSLIDAGYGPATK
jgi:hypothetical protein